MFLLLSLVRKVRVRNKGVTNSEVFLCFSGKVGQSGSKNALAPNSWLSGSLFF